ncbi:MAG TPA: HD-GYP domain-containing protein [Gemmatimonadaceae bacterium]|nr:HD-GYP domain-containing protein [Gemmatimonadaceae bacterium]HRQ77685.1 HD-GYP domain-containing protein [Gemmatimonadaceae bacterium]
MAAGTLVVLAAFAALVAPPTPGEWQAALFFTAFGVLAAALAYKTSTSTSGTISFLPFLSVALVSPNVAALVAVVISTLIAEIVHRRPLLKLVFNTTQHTFAVAVGTALYLLSGGQSALDGTPKFLPFFLLVSTYFVVNKLAVSTVVAASSGTSTLPIWIKSMRGSALYDALSMPLIIFFAIAYSRLGPGWTAILALPMLGIRQLYRTVYALEKVNEELLQLMVASIEARDPYTSGHSQRVAIYAREIARISGLPARQIERVEIAALLHDVGKIHEEFAQILRKPGRLSDEEFETMKLHPVRSAELVAKVSHFSDLVASVRAHHETWEGRGYPDQLRGPEIPLPARVIALADTIDAMTTSRPYRAGMTLEQVRLEIRRESGRQFDPQIAAALTTPQAWTSLAGVVAHAQAEYPAIELAGGVGTVPAGNTGEFVFIASR